MQRQHKILSALFVIIVIAVHCYADARNRSAGRSNVDVTGIEASVNRIKRTVESFNINTPGSDIKLDRDPFAPLAVKIPGFHEVKDIDDKDKTFIELELPEKKVSRPLLNVSGIVSGHKPLAIIDDMVVGEGESIGLFRITRIGNDSVIISKEDKEFTFEINK